MTKEALHRIFTHIPTMETEHLLMRQIISSDTDDMFAYSCREDVTRFLLWDPHPNSTYTRQYIEYLQDRYTLGDFYDWALVERTSGKMIGTCGFTSIDLPNRTAEIGYVISPFYRGRGYAAEASGAVIRFGFEKMELERISAICMKENNASLRVMEKCGMKREGTLRSAAFIKGEQKDLHICAITKNDFYQKKSR
jgi:ribosomal-protein-alanine N-acetyltransferase